MLEVRYLREWFSNIEHILAMLLLMQNMKPQCSYEVCSYKIEYFCQLYLQYILKTNDYASLSNR